jgi:adenylate kinase
LRRVIVIVGIPGVGKSTVVEKLIEIRKKDGKITRVANYGTVMLEEATRIFNVKSRDEMRKLPIDSQKKLQIDAAKKIESYHEDFIIVDTHLFISTKEGFWPGMPVDVLQALRPTNIVLLSADSDVVLRRRQSDATRERDPSTKRSIENERSAAITLLYASSLYCSCPALIVTNEEERSEEAARGILKALESSN